MEASKETCSIGYHLKDPCHKLTFIKLKGLKEIDTLDDISKETLILRTNFVENITGHNICLHHEQKLLNKFHLGQKKCCNPLEKDSHKGKGSLREVTLEMAKKLKERKISIVPGKKICPSCRKDINETLIDEHEEALPHSDEEYWVGFIEETNKGDSEVKMDLARSNTEMATKFKVNGKLEFDMDKRKSPSAMEMYLMELSEVTALKEMANCLAKMEWNMMEPGGETWMNGLLTAIDEKQAERQETLILRTNFVENITGHNICLHHEQKLLNKFHLGQKKCCNPLEKDSHKGKGSLREVTLEMAKKLKERKISIVPGKKICPSCRKDINETLIDEHEEALPHSDEEYWVGFIEETNKGDSEVKMDLARSNTEMATKFKVNGKLEFDMDKPTILLLAVCAINIHYDLFKAKITFSNGDVFDGAFRSDRIEGDGKLSCKNGMEYDGAWRRNMKYGFGKLKMVDGSVYEGSFRNDEFDGDGVLTYSDGSVYRGEFKDGQRDGCGTYTVKNGTCYEGHWMYDLKDGTGTLTFPNGDKYEGAFIEDKRCGEGTMSYNFGGCYTGRWEDDKRQGHGVMEFKDGSKYDGNWTSGQRSGQGIQSYPDGSVYDGEWQFNMFDGTGTLEKRNGWKYKGQWKHGKHHGTGTLTDTANSFKFQGEWQNGKKQGKGIELIYGILFEGEFKNNKRDGRGVETAQDKTTYEGHWKLGQRHGKGAKKLLNGMVQHQVWHMGCLMDCPVLVAREVPPLQRS
eukprot:gene7471-13243_t